MKKYIIGKIIKLDINFLNYPLFILNEKTDNSNIIVNDVDNKKYELISEYKVPNSIDILFLYYFLYLSKERKYENKLILKKAKIIKNVIGNNQTYYYKRLEETLKIWENVSLKFENSFYDGKNLKTLIFKIIDKAYINDEKNLVIILNKKYLNIIKKSKVYKYIDFEEVKRLKKPISKRFYEVLKIYDCNFEIEFHELIKKLNMSCKYSSDLERLLKPAIKEINNQSNLKIKLKINKIRNDKIIYKFKNISNYSFLEKFTFNQRNLFNILKSKYDFNDNDLKDIIEKNSFKKINRVYRYTNEQCPAIKSYFFIEVLKNNFFTNNRKKISFEFQVFLENELKKKLKKFCSYRSCNEYFDYYKYDLKNICYWCPKFEDERSNQLKFEI